MNNKEPSPYNICSVVVTYFPDDNFSSHVSKIFDLTHRLIIIDNCSGENSIEMLRSIATRPGITLVLNKENLGVATAFNQGICAARDQGFSWALLFDQDSSPFASMVEVLSSVYRDYPLRDRLSLIGSAFVDTGIPVVGRANAWWVEKKDVISAGSLVSIEAYNLLGPFRDDYFIDAVDQEFCARSRKAGFSIVMSVSPLMSHSIGSHTLHRFFWKTFRPANHSPTRHYYMVRNYIVLAREYLFFDPLWVLSLAIVRLRELILVIFFENNKLSKITLMALGLWHGLCGKSGKGIFLSDRASS
ncbi:glycosyltransferase [Geopsychrobacter electrodiphilus]|uniref:glycosyltransferase n=1 Tax=Geopsychrobacter electrodiphilus TaxID=225196 RepID=UPI0003A74CCB|nr:glycosyltransferase [Geopsychrobacter electrodiphilus]